MSVFPIKNFLWSNNKPLNYKNTKIKWPFTQNIEKVFEITSGIFISSRVNYNKYKDRIGLKPYFYEVDKITSIDIDWKDDFKFAEKILSVNPKNIFNINNYKYLIFDCDGVCLDSNQIKSNLFYDIAKSVDSAKAKDF